MFPEWLNAAWLRFKALFRRRQLEQDLDDETQFHLAMSEQKLVEQGMAADEAHYAALRRFGNVAAVREECREAWGIRFLNELAQDIRYGLRQLRRNPGFTIVAVFTLALGIGANTAIFSVINAVMLRTLPVHDPEQLMFVGLKTKLSGQTLVSQGFSYPEFKELCQHNQSFTGLLALWGGYRGSLEGHLGNPVSAATNESLHVEMVTANYFSLLGVNAELGRTFTPDENNGVGAHPVAVISYGLRQRLFGRGGMVLGKTITIGDTPFTIVGVAPKAFTGVRSGRICDVWIPVSMQPQVAPGLSLTNNRNSWLNLIGRLKPAVSVKQARANLDLAYQQIQRQQAASKVSPERHEGRLTRHIVLLPAAHGTNYLRNQFNRPLLLLMGMVALVLLIACVNVADLLLARASVRQPEIAVRLALGAGRWRLARQLLTESVLLALIGAALGVLFAYWGSPFLVSLMSHKGLIRGWDQVTLNVRPDLRVLVFTAIVALIAGIAFGLAPALRATRITASLGPQHLTVSRSSRRLGRALVVAQVALSLVMLVGAGLLVRTFHNLEALNPGFNRHHVLLFSLNTAKLGYKPQRAGELQQETFERLQQMPGARSVSYSMVTPIRGGHWREVANSVEGYTPYPGEDMRVYMNVVGPHYFRTLLMPVLRGRSFGPQDHDGTALVALINQAMADRFFGDRSPIGKHFRVANFPDPKLGFEIVGVVGNAKRTSLRKPVKPAVYLYLPQFSGMAPGAATFEIRSAVPPLSLLPQVRHILQRSDSRLIPAEVRTLAEQVDWSLYQEKMMAELSGFFGLLALVLVCVGIYGTMSYTVARRTNEIGIRMSLGAVQRDILRMVLREALLLAFIGIAIGLPVAWAATRSIASRLYGLKATDPLTILGATLLMAAVAVLAGYIPARRAAKVDPMVALRCE